MPCSCHRQSTKPLTRTYILLAVDPLPRSKIRGGVWSIVSKPSPFLRSISVTHLFSMHYVSFYPHFATRNMDHLHSDLGVLPSEFRDQISSEETCTPGYSNGISAAEPPSRHHNELHE